MLLCHYIFNGQDEEQDFPNNDIEIVNAGGGDAAGNEGSLAYSIGTVFYITLQASGRNVTQGAQQTEEPKTEEEEVPEETDPPEEEEVPEAEEPISEPEEEPSQDEDPTTEEPDPTEEEPTGDTPEPEPEDVPQPEGQPDPEETDSLEEEEEAPETEEPISEPEEEPLEEENPASEEEVSDEEGNIIDQNIVDEGLSDAIEESKENRITTYPNPTVDTITLFIENFENEVSLYQLFDSYGKLLESRSITNQDTKIAMNHRSASIYVLRVFISNNEAKTFKIIKH